MVSQDGIPESYKRLPGADRVVTSYQKGRDLAIAVDCGALELLGKTQQAFHLSKRVLQIDHHEVGDHFGDLLLIDSALPAAGEGVYHLLRALDIDIDLDIAQCLLTSIVVETGFFEPKSTQIPRFRVPSSVSIPGRTRDRHGLFLPPINRTREFLPENKSSAT